MGDLSSGWARMASLGGGRNGGIYFIPEVNDEVLVVFEQGDVNSSLYCRRAVERKG